MVTTSSPTPTKNPTEERIGLVGFHEQGSVRANLSGAYIPHLLERNQDLPTTWQESERGVTAGNPVAGHD